MVDIIDDGFGSEDSDKDGSGAKLSNGLCHSFFR
jgi:hypothetical protein